MLLTFRFSNYKSFREEQELSMVANRRDHTHMDHTALVAGIKEPVLRAAALYGANASGKSNVLKALGFVKQFLTEPINPSNPRLKPDPFLLATATRTSPSTFDITFLQEEVRYEYSLAVDYLGVVREELVAYPKGKPQRWYTRYRDSASNQVKIDFGSSLKGQLTTLEKLTRPDVAFLTVAAGFEHSQLTQVYNWFLRKLQLWFGGPDNMVMAQAVALTSTYVANRTELIPSLEKLLRLADLGIVELGVREEGVLPSIIQELSSSSDEKDQASRATRRYLTFAHQGDTLLEQFALDNESHGTRQLLILGTLLLDGMRDGCTIIVDELDASLHPQLVRALVEMFYQDNPYNAQIIFNTHDATLLSRDLFRRDQVWFVEKDRQGASHLSPLLDFSPRKEGNVERNYLRGQYGAVPFIESEDWRGLVHDATS